MFSRALKVLVVDAVLLAALFYVVQDLHWRSDYAAATVSRCAGECSYAPSFSYGFLTQVFTMSGNFAKLASPATLDWTQALAYALILLNAWLVYTYWGSRRTAPTSVPSAPAS